jgi:hypothetical protein
LKIFSKRLLQQNRPIAEVRASGGVVLRISEDDLQSIAGARGQEHLLAISGRQTVGASLSDNARERILSSGPEASEVNPLRASRLSLKRKDGTYRILERDIISDPQNFK